MQETKFTPGPWRYCGQDRDQCKCGRVWSIPSDFEVATCELKNEENGSEITMEQMMANARLIAAAPEMFEKLYKAAKLLTQKGYLMFASDIEEMLNRITTAQASVATKTSKEQNDGQQ